MKIVVISSFPENLINFRGPLLAALVGAGHDVIACAPGGDHQTESALRALGVTFRPIPLDRRGLNPLRDGRLLVSLVALLRELAPDAVLSYSIKPVVYGSLAAMLAGVPIIDALITGLGYVFSGDSPKQRLLRAFSLTLYRVGLLRARVVYFQNPDDEALFRRFGLIGPRTRTVQVNGSGVDLAHFARAGAVTEGPVFLQVARLIEEKGVLDFVAAARLLKRTHPGAVCRLLGMYEQGAGGIRPAQVAAWEREGVIEYLGETQDVRPFLAAASVFVLPSYYREGVPRSVLEAMAMGRPIITTDAPGCRETVEPGLNGYLVPARDPEALAAAMARFADEPEAIARMGANSHAIACAKYDVHVVNRAFLDAFAPAPAPRVPLAVES